MGYTFSVAVVEAVPGRGDGDAVAAGGLRAARFAVADAHLPAARARRILQVGRSVPSPAVKPLPLHPLFIHVSQRSASAKVSSH